MHQSALALIRGLLIGLSVAATVGPMSVLCIQRTLNWGFRYGFISGLGIATTDALYGSVAGFSLTVVSTVLLNQQLWIHTIGGLFLLYLGAKTLLTPPASRATITRPKITTALAAYLSTFLLTLTNPLTILSFTAIFAGVGIGSEKNSALSASLVVCGVFIGSAVWWALLTAIINFYHSKFTSLWLLWINRASGFTILLFGILTLISLIKLNS